MLNLAGLGLKPKSSLTNAPAFQLRRVAVRMHRSTTTNQPKSCEPRLTTITLIGGCLRKRNLAKQALIPILDYRCQFCQFPCSLSKLIGGTGIDGSNFPVLESSGRNYVVRIRVRPRIVARSRRPHALTWTMLALSAVRVIRFSACDRAATPVPIFGRLHKAAATDAGILTFAGPPQLFESQDRT